ncbi:hypothetical protein NC653_039526 [Populus alba x Populus x berolinensis]|uniref:Uncharacterized protein n=1 Tax=Populus alba x Populus x berolinensis TaxID=444605 RepID=A0AAD6LCZ1_9ROSI|nr:hypothetical protein NC653_039526 [Populus alba x Populus x berolinensis]
MNLTKCFSFNFHALNLGLHEDFLATYVRAFVCDLTVDALSSEIPPSSIEIVTVDKYHGLCCKKVENRSREKVMNR